MDRMHCDIVKDLLPLYVDDVCSEKSREMLEKHLKECEDCRKYYESLIDKTPEVVADEGFSFFQESEFIQKIKKKITFDMVVAGFAVFLVCTIGSIMLKGHYTEPGFAFFGLIDQRLELDNIEVTEMYQLESGEIYFEAKSDKKITWPYTDAMIYDEERKINYSKAMFTYIWWDDYIKGNGTVKEAGFVYSTENVDEIYFEGKNDEKMLIWKEEQNL